MNLQISELVDKTTILMVKDDHGLNVEDELNECLKELKEKSIGEDLIIRLYKINSMMWDCEDEISAQVNTWEVGWIYKNKLRPLTIDRNRVKNEITEKYGGFKELKKY